MRNTTLEAAALVLLFATSAIADQARSEPRPNESRAMSSSSTDLPEATRSVVVCLYHEIKSTPGVTGVDVYVPGIPVIVYSFNTSGGKDQIAEFAVQPGFGGVHYAGDYSQPHNPVAPILSRLDGRCRATSGWVDEFFITGPDNDPLRYHVDMSQYEK